MEAGALARFKIVSKQNDEGKVVCESWGIWILDPGFGEVTLPKWWRLRNARLRRGIYLKNRPADC